MTHSQFIIGGPDRNPLKTFAELKLIQPLQDAIADQGYETPTPIQARTIIPAMEGRDVLGCAQTGTGKTAAFALPMLSRLGKRNRKSIPGEPFGLILAPTRELAIQIEQSLQTYGAHLRLRTALVYGGVGQGKQVRQLQRGAHILVATPGRLLDLMDQGHLSLSRLEMFVLDEADRMLDMGFLPALRRIIRELPTERQSLFFSATMPPEIQELVNRLLHDPVRVSLAPKRPTVEKIDQLLLFTKRSEKPNLLAELLKAPEVYRAVVFTRTKRGADAVARRLVKRGIPSIAIHGNKSQNSRQRSLEGFRKNHYQVLVATDVAARGIDIDGVTHVVNYDLPEEPESYVHRIGRTGRAGAVGIALSLCMESEMDALRGIEKLIGFSIPVHADYPAGEAHLAADSKRAPRGRRTKGRSGNSQPKNSRAKNGRAAASGKPSDRGKSNRATEAASGKQPRASKGNRRKPAPAKRTESESPRRQSANQTRGGETVVANELSSESRRSDDPAPTRSSKPRKRRSKRAMQDSESRGARSTKSKRRSTKKKHKVKGSTSNSRTTPKPLSKKSQRGKTRKKSANASGESSRQRTGSSSADKPTSGSRASGAAKPRRSKTKALRTAKRRPKG